METKYIDEINTIEKLIDRSKDTNVIYLTEDTILNTKAVQKIANRLEQLEKENKELKNNCKKCIVRDRLSEYVENSIPKSVIREEIEKLERDAEKIREKKKDANDSDRSKARMQAYLTKTNEIKKRLEELLGEEK